VQTVNQEVRARIKILETSPSKGFTLLELLIVISIIAVSATSFFIFSNTINTNDNIREKIQYYRELSLHTGNEYSFSNEGVFLSIDNSLVKLEDFNALVVLSVNTKDDQTRSINKEPFLSIYSGMEVNIKSLKLSDGTTIIL
jgi:prepilin-type N-terminal cleavage/methylation domain-containing protein